MRNSTHWLCVFACLAAITQSACQRTPNADNPALAGLPDNKTSVGPIPGPNAAPSARPGPHANDANAMREGRTLFVRYNCSGCHGGRAGGGMGPSLRDQDWMYGHNDAQIFDSIAQGRANGMPAWGAKIPEDQIWKLVAYIDSMRTPDEPDAPR